jgi:transcriptional regulator with XRE-family HTH domain
MSVDLTPVLSPVRELGEFIREQREAAQISVRGLAAKAGVSNPYLSQVERGLRRPSADILAQIAQGLSISVETLLVKAGVLPAGETPQVVAAIRADTELSERHKSALIDIYLAFRKETGGAADAATPDTGIEPAEPTSKTGTAPVPGKE